jgi:sulfate adenylyltransferase subunit 1 (EFTu-like GTPase family)
LEFLKNMVTGAARAEAGILVIEAREGVQENSRRHGYLASLLGIRKMVVCINKMDLVGYERHAFESIRSEYAAFLEHVGIRPKSFIPAAAREGDNIVQRSAQMTWYDGPTVLEALDGFAKDALPVENRCACPCRTFTNSPSAATTAGSWPGGLKRDQCGRATQSSSCRPASARR